MILTTVPGTSDVPPITDDTKAKLYLSACTFALGDTADNHIYYALGQEGSTGLENESRPGKRAADMYLRCIRSHP